ncbi:MAG: Eco29kI family restriction endonuclease [Fimbriimonadaceae bacterium]|nr:Eco29kI family restriction endonuclease [Fimbriimonadaceae bacterium]
MEEDLRRIVQEISDRSEQLLSATSDRKKGESLRSLEAASAQLERLMARLDPVAEPQNVFDPSAPATAGRIAALALVAQPVWAMDEIDEFYGSGIYAIYYSGGFGAYKPIAGTNHPIYVGKSDPEDAGAETPREQGLKLFGRIREHSKSIKASSNLDIADFGCRFLVVQSGYQFAAESHLIRLFKPIWNREIRVAYGIGKHGDSASTRANKRSPWDTLHPGRNWADKTKEDQQEFDQILGRIREHFKKNPPRKGISEIVHSFLTEMRQF